MTFFLMKNRFQQQQADKTDENATRPSRTTGNFLNALFGSSSAGTESTRKPSQTSETSTPSRASSASGRSHAYPPRRISFDEVDYGATREQGVRASGGSARPPAGSNNTANASRVFAAADNNRPEDHSSGTTDPPDDDLDGDLNGEEGYGASARHGSVDHGSESSGPDSPQEAVPGMDDDLVLFMRQFVEQIFLNNQVIDQVEKNQFGEFARLESGRLWFARFVNSQRINYSSKVDDGTFYRLVQYCAIVLFECYQEEDYGPAKILMNICFTFYKEVPPGTTSRRVRREFLYHHLRKQAIWHSLKFWNAAYFDAMQADRARRSHRERADNNAHPELSQSYGRSLQRTQSGTATTDDDYVYRTLADFITNMRAFHVARESVIEFVRKQSHNVNPDQFRALREQLDAMYA